jgi:hypothetical protein
MKPARFRRPRLTSRLPFILMSGLLPLIVGGMASARIPETPKAVPHRRAATSAISFPSYVRQAMHVAASTTRVPVLGPVWLPDTKAEGRRLMPPGGTFAATVKATPTSYQINFWVEAHALPVNSPKVVQDSDDPDVTPIVTVSGRRDPTKAVATKRVWNNVIPVPRTAKRVTITANISGWLWKVTDRLRSSGLIFIAWKERGWLVETAPIIPPNTDGVQVAVGTAKALIPKVLAAMPGQTGTIAIAMGDGMHTTAMWQRGRLVYSVFANYGLSSATTVVGSLYPMPRR